MLEIHLILALISSFNQNKKGKKKKEKQKKNEVAEDIVKYRNWKLHALKTETPYFAIKKNTTG